MRIGGAPISGGKTKIREFVLLALNDSEAFTWPPQFKIVSESPWLRSNTLKMLECLIYIG